MKHGPPSPTHHHPHTLMHVLTPLPLQPPFVLYSLFKTWNVPPGSDFSPTCSGLLAFLFPRVPITLALTARVRGEAEEVVKEENQFHSLLVPSFSIRFT